MPWFDLLGACVLIFIGGTALYLGITGKDIYPGAPFQTVPLPKPIGRIICFGVFGMAIYMLIGVLQGIF
jgi:hypothetical protein